MLSESVTFDEAKQIRDQAEAMQVYAQRQKYSVQCVNYCVEIKIRAERRLGQMLTKTSDSKAWKRPKPERGGLPTLEDLGLNIGQSRDWQRLATLDDEEFEGWVQAAKTAGEKLNMTALLDRANQEQSKGKYRGQTPKVFLLHLVHRVNKLGKALERVLSEREAMLDQQPEEMKALREAIRLLPKL